MILSIVFSLRFSVRLVSVQAILYSLSGVSLPLPTGPRGCGASREGRCQGARGGAPPFRGGARQARGAGEEAPRGTSLDCWPAVGKRAPRLFNMDCSLSSLITSHRKKSVAVRRSRTWRAWPTRSASARRSSAR